MTPGAVWTTSPRDAASPRMPRSRSVNGGVRQPRPARPASRVAERSYRVELTASFLQHLDVIEAFLLEADAGFDKRLDDLRANVIPNLRRFQFVGRRYLNHPP